MTNFNASIATRLVAQFAMLLLACGLMSPTPAQAATAKQHNCSFTVAKAAVSKGKLTFAVPVSCRHLQGWTKRQIVVDVMWATGYFNEKKLVSWHRHGLPTTSGIKFTYAKSGIWCNKNTKGTEKIYLKARIEAYGSPNLWDDPNKWYKGKDVWGDPITVNCY